MAHAHFKFVALYLWWIVGIVSHSADKLIRKMRDEAIKVRHSTAIAAIARLICRVFYLPCSLKIGTHTPVLLSSVQTLCPKITPTRQPGAQCLLPVIDKDTYLLNIDLNLLENLNTNQNLNYIKLENNLLQLQERGQALESLNGQIIYGDLKSNLNLSAPMETFTVEFGHPSYAQPPLISVKRS